MAEYIEREALLKWALDSMDAQRDVVGKAYCAEFVRAIRQFKAADVDTVVHGRWEEYDRFVRNSDGEPVAKIGVTFVCSECGREADLKEPYCHCGARMDGE